MSKSQGAPKARLSLARYQIMPYRLRDDVSYCEVGGHLIFLDTLEDRYFRLQPAVEHAFFDFAKGDNTLSPNLRGLIEGNILIEAPMSAVRAPTAAVPLPTRSATEESSLVARPKLDMLLEVAFIVYLTKLQLKTRNLNDFLNRLRVYRDSRAVKSDMPLAEFATRDLLQASRRSCALGSASHAKHLVFWTQSR